MFLSYICLQIVSHIIIRKNNLYTRKKMSEVPDTVYRILNQVVNGKINDYVIEEHDKNKNGEGYLGDICFVSLKNKDSDQTLHYVVKQAFSTEIQANFSPLRELYLNEINFYTIVWPRFQKFQNEKLDGTPYDEIPQCFATSSKEKNEKLVLENLKFQDFQLHNKAYPLSKEQAEFVFEQYGRFHAISFAYKTLYPEEYSELSGKLKNIWGNLITIDVWRDYLQAIYDVSLEFLDPDEEKEVIEKYERFAKHAMEIFHDKCQYKGRHSVILHGDSWSNNMMFKYDESNRVTDIRLLDFQFSCVGTPVYDLSFFMYSSATKSMWNELDCYLRLYHDSLSKTLENFGCNSRDCYPFEQLQEDWKEYCTTGVSLAFNTLKMKNTPDDDVKDLRESFEAGNEILVHEFVRSTSYEPFKKIIRDLIFHIYENDFI
ncbi:hypothetical protein NQ317_006545 [Molorchus minor]|uniref:CHK kinase-like domain-containing protein n=1 Tax=Molorchus minor TaxID=1323400 RepID=A0ABQ9J1A3_9CUCU|nr:hypothetical protein NQ317_006545 [Molorchus minor]